MEERIIKWRTGEPKEDGRYIITNIEGKVDIDYYSYRHGWGYYHNKAVIAWCKLNDVEPYKKIEL